MFYPQVRTVFEMGGEASKYLRLDPNVTGKHLGIVDYQTSGECAAGTGSFIDQQATRLLYSIEQVGPAACGASCAARIAGRCSVFAKTDMIHAQQKGYTTEQILRGLCDAVARNYKSSLVKGRAVVPPVAFIGGVAMNQGVRNALREAFKLKEADLLIPEHYAWLGAMGAAMLESEEYRKRSFKRIHQLRQHEAARKNFACTEPLSMENVLLLRDRERTGAGTSCSRRTRLPPDPDADPTRVEAYLGIDIGSVSTNLVVIDADGNLLKEIYLRTQGRPIEVVDRGLKEIEAELAASLDIRGVGTTGSGRELIGELVGADTVNDEITAHKTGSMHVCKQMGMDPVDTIFEIGGQDSKFIRIDKGVVVDFTMNEACAAGTGSFLEEQAEKLGISIKEEFAQLALASASPARLGERCTVFMERDVTGLMHKGAEVGDLAAGLAYSVALNYLNRVVRGRKIGKVIFFQGGTAYNDAVAAAFSQILGKQIIVPPHNGVIGAIGMALIARDRMKDAGQPSRFRGYDLSRVNFTTREFVCQACSNFCDMKEFNIEGQRTYWGDKCSDKFRKRARTDRQPVIEDLIEWREKLLEEVLLPTAGRQPHGGNSAHHVLLRPLPLLVRLFPGAGFRRRGVFAHRPQDFHGGRGVGHRPALLPGEGGARARAGPAGEVRRLRSASQRRQRRGAGRPGGFAPLPLEPDAAFRDSRRAPTGSRAGQVSFLPPCTSAWAQACGKATGGVRAHPGRQAASQRRCRDGGLRRAGSLYRRAAGSRQARRWPSCEETGEPALVLVGRPYNLYDRSVNCDIPRKLRTLYGVNVLPMEVLPLDEEDITDVNPNMYWNSGRRILAAARIARRHPNLHLVYISNFKCGPDSYIKSFMDEAAGKPSLVLQFDGHANDAGFITRCEAYLDSKGFLRCPSSATAIAAAK